MWMLFAFHRAAVSQQSFLFQTVHLRSEKQQAVCKVHEAFQEGATQEQVYNSLADCVGHAIEGRNSTMCVSVAVRRIREVLHCA